MHTSVFFCLALPRCATLSIWRCLGFVCSVIEKMEANLEKMSANKHDSNAMVDHGHDGTL